VGVSVTGPRKQARATATDTAPLTVERDRVDADEHGRVGGSGSLTIAVG